MAMAFTSISPLQIQLPINHNSSRTFLSLPLCSRTCALKSGSGGEKLRKKTAYGENLLRKPTVQPAAEAVDYAEKSFDRVTGGEEEQQFVDWEDKILEDTVPLVGFVRMILQSGTYASGDRLSLQHETTIIERLLQYHPECDKKIGSGIDYITLGYHPEYEMSRCLFIVRKDGELVDFSYWKCIKGFIHKKYPLHADTFIFRHFQKRNRS